MKIEKKKIYFFFILVLSICLSVFSWNLINLPITDAQIVGNYSLKKVNPFNDIIRYLVFISIPISVYILWEIIVEKKKIKDFFFNIIFKKENFEFDKKIYWFQLLIIFYLFLEFLSVSFPINLIDIYHEGQKLSSAFKNKLDGSLWSGSYVTVGIIYETLGAKYIWKLFGSESIGLVRFLDILYIFITKIILIFLSLEITKTTKFNSLFSCCYFLTLSFIFLSFTNYNLGTVDLISYREIPILLSLIFFLITLKKLNQLHFAYIILGFLTVTTFFWSIDRAIVQNLMLLLIIIYLIINKSYKNIFLLIISLIFFWFVFYLFLNDEFNLFVENTISIYREMSAVHGIIHPEPFADEENSSRATKNLLSILISLLVSLNIIFKDRNYFSYRFKIIIILISLLSFLSYIYALGRSDGVHLKQAFGFSAIFISSYLLFYLFYFVSTKLNNINFNSQKIFFIIILIFIFIFFSPNVNFSNIIDYKSRFINYINLKDDVFLSKSDKRFIKETSKLINNEKCIQLYTNDAALLYLLRKPNCTKFYFVWSIGSKKNQLMMISELQNTNFIITNGSTDNWGIPLNTKYPLIKAYIDQNFIIEKKINGRKILIKK